MYQRKHAIHLPRVALRKESVDRNVSAFDVLAISAVSLSARRAWIEISLLCRILFRR